MTLYFNRSSFRPFVISCIIGGSVGFGISFINFNKLTFSHHCISQNINKIKIKTYYIYKIKKLLKEYNYHELIVLFNKLYIDLGYKESLLEIIIDSLDEKELNIILEKLDINIFNIVLHLMITRIKKSDKNILTRFKLLLDNKHTSQLTLSVEDFKVCATKLSVYIFIKLCKNTQILNDDTFVILILQLFTDDRNLLFEAPYSEPGSMDGGRGIGYEYYELGRLVEKSIIEYLQYRSEKLLKECVMYESFPIEKLDSTIFNDDIIKSTIQCLINKNNKTFNILKFLKYGTEHLLRDKMFIKKVAEFFGYSLKYANILLLDDDNFLLELNEREGHVLDYCSSRLKSNKEFVMQILSKTDKMSILKVYYNLDKTLRIQPDVLLYCINKNNLILKELKPEEEKIYMQNK